MPIHKGLRPMGLALLTVLLPSALLAQDAETAFARSSTIPTLTLEAALQAALANSPTLAKARAESDLVRGQLIAARTLPNNPELEIEIADRQGVDQRSTDFSVSLWQELEVGGQRRKRARAAELELESTESTFLREQRVLAASVTILFGEAIAARQLAELRETEAELARGLRGVTERRFEAGAATQIDLNLARASTARAERRAEMAAALEHETKSLLAEVVGLDPAEPPQPMGLLRLPENELPPLEILVAGALERRADLEALQQSLRAAEARLVLEKANRIPALSIGAFYEEEDGTDSILGGSFQISLPLFNRQQGMLGETAAMIERSTAEATLQNLAVRREVYSAVARYRAARASADQLAENVVGNLSDSLQLLQRSFAAGKIGISELLLLRRELVESQREAIEARTSAWAARATLDLALGQLPVAAVLTSKNSTLSLGSSK